MSTVRQMAQTVLEELKVYGPGEDITDADAQRVLDQLGKMLDSWSNESLMCYAIKQQSHVLTVGDADYTIGSGGNINSARPIRLIEGPGAAFIRDSNSVNYPVNVVTRDKWNQIGQLTQTSDLPNTLFYDAQYPLGIINIFPIPLVANTLYFTSLLQLNESGAIDTLDDNLTFPPGYELAIQKNLCVIVKPFFKSAQLDPDIASMAMHTKRVLKRANKRTMIAQFDVAIVAKVPGAYNIFSDSYNRRS